MRAQVGDQLVIEGRTTEIPRQVAEVIEVRGDNGSPPYLVRYPDGHEGLMFPGPDAHVVHGE
jgi:hypothetical protein